MERIRLREYLAKEGELHNGIAVSNSIIKSLEVYGFINCKSRDDILSGYNLRDINSFGDIEIQIDYSKCKVFSFFLKQDRKVTPIYPIISICQKDIDVDVKELYIPSFVGTYTSTNGSAIDERLYSNIKRRYGTGYEVSESEWEKAGWPSRYSLIDGSVISHIQKGEVILKDKDDCIKSVGDSIVVLCRYIFEETGEIRFLLSRLEQLYYEVKGAKK